MKSRIISKFDDYVAYGLGDGRYHRIGGPARIWPGGKYGVLEEWYVNGKLHRIDGPAYIGKDGTQEWYIDNKNITKEVEEWLKCNDISYPFDEIALMQFKLRFL
jgi:hypothetical protein